MGIKNLNKILKKECKNGIKKVNIKSLKGKCVGIDTSIFLYKYTYMGDMLLCFLKQIEHLLSNNITPVYLFDGKPTDDKNNLILKRKETYKSNNEKIDTLKEKKKELLENNNSNEEELLKIDLEIQKKTKNNIKVNYNDVNKLKEILKNFGIYYYNCDGETDSYIKSFFNKKLIDYVITEDLDFLTHGCQYVIYNYNYNSNNILLYDLNIILNELELEYDSFINMCIVLGSDYYMKGIKNIGPVKGYKLIKKYKNIEKLLESDEKIKINEDFNYNNIISLFLEKKELNITKEDLKISKKKINLDYFTNFDYNISNIIELINNFRYEINILTFLNNKL